MKITNKLGLPEAIVKAIENREYTKGEADISVTSLLMPPQMYRLLQLYGGQLEVDASDSIWALFGTAVHHILSMANLDDVVQEERLYLKVADWIVSGQPDIYKKIEKVIEDYKVTSAYKVMKGEYDDWAFQLNVYKLLLEAKGVPVEGLRIIAILRDWSFKEARSEKNPDYPKVQVVPVSLPVWKPIDTLIKVAERIKVHQSVQGLGREELPPCNADERWAGQSSYVVAKPDNSYTYRNYPYVDGDEADKKRAEQEAYITLSEMKAEGYKVMHREGLSLRCEYFCPVRDVCFQRSGKTPEAVLPSNEITSKDVAAVLGE